MEYVESFDLFGTKVRPVPCIRGSGAPTSATEGAVGLFYMDIDNGEVYKCVAAIGNSYTWRNLINGGGGHSGAEIDDNAIGANAWSSKNIVDRLCPAFSESGTLVQYEAVEGYSLSVQAQEGGEEPGVTVTVCGKNLYDKATYPANITGYAYAGTTSPGRFSTTDAYRRTEFIPVPHLAGQSLVLSHPTNGSNPGTAFYTRIPNINDIEDCKAAFCGGSTKAIINVPENAMYMVMSFKVDDVDKDIQLEIGSEATAYESYSGAVFTVSNEASAAFIPVPGIVGRSGLTTIFAYDGEGKATEVKVSGRADPVAMINALVTRVADLEKATVNNT